ncbi:hypothetical protein Xcel_3456 (plasmid) [Xylanimonas cellulosilytica DSM 15894]|uniref:Uncharacterized protein n=1 Tax=Xylanimonas cellulosilytica (strain DSM 15894 / JCM 12276 / CECT 5975 / KCTC 9989 / LMG 20990 / NBRC 107835 / XIL07) TaxID=446471 RepID=D1C0Y9_XYLCX|nr:hypothetical protein Xcel_3456 [Xylanimonas cellulosilytica DSM 15894]
MADRSALKAAQRVIGEVLIPEAREAQAQLPAMDESLPIALELAYTALAMKAAFQQPAMFIARRYAARMGLDPDQVEAFALRRLQEELAKSDG